MCIICAAIPATAAVGAKLNVDQLTKPEDERKPISKITGGLIAVLVITSAIYHTLRWQV
jgi:formylmethanofuran dehydrogenase subunit A